MYHGLYLKGSGACLCACVCVCVCVCVWEGGGILHPYINVGSFDGELVEPLVVADHAVAGLGGGQLRAQHAPGQPEVHHALQSRGPVV